MVFLMNPGCCCGGTCECFTATKDTAFRFMVRFTPEGTVDANNFGAYSHSMLNPLPFSIPVFMVQAAPFASFSYNSALHITETRCRLLFTNQSGGSITESSLDGMAGHKGALFECQGFSSGFTMLDSNGSFTDGVLRNWSTCNISGAGGFLNGTDYGSQATDIYCDSPSYLASWAGRALIVGDQLQVTVSGSGSPSFNGTITFTISSSSTFTGYKQFNATNSGKNVTIYQWTATNEIAWIEIAYGVADVWVYCPFGSRYAKYSPSGFGLDFNGGLLTSAVLL